MTDMPKLPPPSKPSPVIVALQKEAKRQGLTAYAIAKAKDMRISTVQRALDGDVSPTLSTVEAVADALGQVVRIEPKKT